MTSEVKLPVVAWRDDGLQAANGTVGTEHRVVTAKTKADMPRSAMEPYTDALVLQTDALAAIEAARVEARAKALEEAAKECKRIANEKWAAYKGRTAPVSKDDLYNPHTEGMSDGADVCADAIGALKAKEAP